MAGLSVLMSIEFTVFAKSGKAAFKRKAARTARPEAARTAPEAMANRIRRHVELDFVKGFLLRPAALAAAYETLWAEISRRIG